MANLAIKDTGIDSAVHSSGPKEGDRSGKVCYVTHLTHILMDPRIWGRGLTTTILATPMSPPSLKKWHRTFLPHVQSPFVERTPLYDVSA